MMRPRRRWAVGGAVLAGAALIVAGVVAGRWTTPTAPVADRAAAVTAEVEHTTLVAQTRLHGQLSYGPPQPLAPSTGMITRVPEVGQVIQRGEAVYEMEGSPVVLFAGPRPFWRELSVDSTDGEDVRQLQSNLRDLGFDPGRDDGRFDWRTGQAVRAWQRSAGLPQTGVLSPTSVVVADAPSIRIAEVTARPGDAASSPATYTTTELRATATLTTSQARRLPVGAPASIDLPDGTTTAATVAAVDPGGDPSASDDDERTPPGARFDIADHDAVTAAGAGEVRITVTHDDDEEPTLVVPVHALIATADGGYAVERLVGDDVQRTPVMIGRVAEARVQILASGDQIEGGGGVVLKAGDRVVLAR